ncbi:hypothetical protein GCM10018781_04230 [Kitasatospora indigofera]|uniref:Thioesterase domain-containing protein n=1 Tax=Kitasatospora indigofera TaxID=67307 RepID=A0A919KKL8_9ACTN|nr:alpha/beta fold hydrolase [Kitasatospora indigofera]GHH60139.1 hypothetical protein GCM10018781_04230 [Kitasatospora indigofera]
MTRYLSDRHIDLPTGALRMFCFPFAGGGASSYVGWQRRLGPEVQVVPVRLPGREDRLAEPRFTDLDALVTELDEQLGPELDHPHVFFGHSMGALIAFSLAERRHARGQELPEALLLSGYRARHLPAPRIADRNASDEELAAVLAALGGIPQRLLEHPEWLSALLPVARDDLLLCAGPLSRAIAPLPVPLYVFAGSEDRLVAPEAIRLWEQHTTGPFEMDTFAGGHFFIRDCDTEFLARVAQLLRRHGAAGTASGARPPRLLEGVSS